MKISIITPSFNQGVFIERTIQSVISQQGDFELEYLVIDGGSTDDTLNILQQYDTQITWISEPDDGQSDAINKGFEMASGDLLAWLNSDDTYLPGALGRVATEYQKTPFDWCFGNCKIVNEHDEEIRQQITQYKIWQTRRYSYHRILRRNFISQPAVFFSQRAYRKIGDINRTLRYTMDYEYWLRLGKVYEPVYIDQFLANFRWHEQSKCGRHYRKMAWEAFQNAKTHAPKGSWKDLFWHYIHYHTLNILYRFL